MIDIRKAWWAIVLVAAFAGCGSEEPTGTNAPPPPAGPGMSGPPPAMPPANPAEEAKGEPKPAADAEPAKTEPPKTDEPKIEGPKVEAPAVTPAPAKSETPEKKDEAAKKDDEASVRKVSLTSEEVAEIDKLPAAEKAIALKQLVCPVSGEHLGSMGTPLKVTAEGKQFLLCCKGCDPEVKANPKAVVAKLNPK